MTVCQINIVSLSCYAVIILENNGGFKFSSWYSTVKIAPGNLTNDNSLEITIRFKNLFELDFQKRSKHHEKTVAPF